MEFKAHDRVRFRSDTDIAPSFHNLEGEVVGEHGGKYGALLVKLDDPKQASMRPDGAWVVLKPELYLELLTVRSTEQPCQTCLRMNDNSATACWWCGNKPR